MGENMMNSAHKTSTELSRQGWEHTFGKRGRYCVKCGEYVGLFTPDQWKTLQGICNTCYLDKILKEKNDA